MKLEWYEMVYGAFVGIGRAVFSRIRKDSRRWEDSRYWDNEVEGALGEIAFAKMANRYWGGHVGPKASVADVDGTHIRQTSHLKGCLCIRLDECGGKIAGRVYALMVGSRGEYDLRGFMTNDEAQKHPQWIKPDHEKYYIPQEFLHSSREAAENWAVPMVDIRRKARL